MAVTGLRLLSQLHMTAEDFHELPEAQIREHLHRTYVRVGCNLEPETSNRSEMLWAKLPPWAHPDNTTCPAPALLGPVGSAALQEASFAPELKPDQSRLRLQRLSPCPFHTNLPINTPIKQP